MSFLYCILDVIKIEILVINARENTFIRSFTIITNSYLLISRIGSIVITTTCCKKKLS